VGSLEVHTRCYRGTARVIGVITLILVLVGLRFTKGSAVRPHANRKRVRLALTILAASLGLFALVTVMPLEVRDSDDSEAARSIVAWIVESRRIPGFWGTYPDARWMRDQRRFFVVSEFLPQSVVLSEDHRVRRITQAQCEQLFEQYGYDDTDYLVLELKGRSQTRITIEASNMFGGLAGHGYRFVFRRTVFGLRAKGQFLWVS